MNRWLRSISAVPRAQPEWRTSRRSTESLEQTSFSRRKPCSIVKGNYWFSRSTRMLWAVSRASVAADYGLLEGSPPVAGLLGAETLRRHHGIIDFGTRTLYLR